MKYKVIKSLHLELVSLIDTNSSFKFVKLSLSLFICLLSIKSFFLNKLATCSTLACSRCKLSTLLLILLLLNILKEANLQNMTF